MDNEKKQEDKLNIEAMMITYKELAIPGIPHQQLAYLEGTWTTRTRSYMEPDKPPMETTGTCVQKMLLGGRYLQQVYTGDMMGDPFSGINIIGYDNHTGKYVSTWIDTMSTGIYYFEGTMAADGWTITQECSYDDPVRGPMTWRSVTRFVDGDTMEVGMYLRPQGGEEEKAMEMTVTRVQ